MTNTTDITDITDAELDTLLGLDDAPEQTYEEILAESRAVLAEAKALRIAYYDSHPEHLNRYHR